MTEIFPPGYRLTGAVRWTLHLAIVALALVAPEQWQICLPISLAWFVSAFVCVKFSEHRRKSLWALGVSFLLASHTFLVALLGFACAHSMDCL
jgi:hypothetical protein